MFYRSNALAKPGAVRSPLGACICAGALALALIGARGGRASDAIDAQGVEAIKFLSVLLDAKAIPSGDQSARQLYQTIYWLRVATRSDLSPEGAIAMAAERGGFVLPQLNRRQLMADWKVASVDGLFTPENLARLRDGTAPVATDGRFSGKRIDVVRINPASIGQGLNNLAFCPEGIPLPADASAMTAGSPMPSAQTGGRSFMPPGVMLSTPPWAGAYNRDANYWPQAYAPPRVDTGAMPPLRAEQVELHDVAFNSSLPLGGTRKLAVASVNAAEVSVSIIGDGPKVWKPASNEVSGGDYYPSVHNTKVPKALPIRLPGVTGDAYLIHSEGLARYYFVDTTVNNGAAFRIAKVVGPP